MKRYSYTPVVIVTSILCFAILCSHAQSTALIITNRNAKVIFDGEEKGACEPNKPFKIVTTEGEHYAQVQYNSDGNLIDKSEVINLETGKQKVIKLMFDESLSQPSVLNEIQLAELNFSIPGSVNVGLWMNQNPNATYPYPAHYMAFEKGDEINLDVSMTNKNGTNQIEISTYPNNVVKYTNKAFSELTNLKIKVEERSIYRFTFATNHAFDRNCIVKIKRKPTSSDAVNFNTNVSKQRKYKPVSVVEPTALRVNSASNATFSGGKSRVLVPVNMPSGTVEWYYRFSASRNQEDIDHVRKNFQLFGELAQLFLTSSGFGVVSGQAVKIGVEQLSMPPGSNHCDVFLLDYNNISGFEAKTDSWKYILEGSRENLKSGNVKIDCCKQGQYYLGIRNPDLYDGINVSIEVIAVTMEEDYVMEGNSK
jgi:hypothetical protein